MLKKYALKRLRRNIPMHLLRIEVTSGKGMFQHRCHDNALQDHYDNGTAIVSVACIGRDNKIFAHFVNGRGDEYIDNTLGYLSRFYEYYLLHEYCSVDDTRHGGDYLMAAKQGLLTLLQNRFLQWWYKPNENGISIV